MKPFNDYDLGKILNNQWKQALDKIDCFTNEEVMQNSLELLSENIYQEFFIEPFIILDEDYKKREVNQKKIKKYIDPFFRDYNDDEYTYVDGVEIKIYYPYSGEKDLLKCRPSVFLLGGYPNITVEKDYIVLSVEKTLSETKAPTAKDDINKTITRDKEEIVSALKNINASVESFNNNLTKRALEELNKKKAKIEQYYEVSRMLEVPIEKTDYAKKIIPFQRRIMPIAHKYRREDYYGISNEEYNNILFTIKHTLTTYESTPCSYKSLGEEELRDTLLAALNGTYLGAATGETFRKKGKTDIRIEANNRAAFIGECKIWNGKKSIETSLNQLDSYLTWRDCKTALIYFVRKKNFFPIINSIYDTLNEIENIKSIKELDKNEYECDYYSKSNEGQLISIRVMLFNLYCDNKKIKER